MALQPGNRPVPPNGDSQSGPNDTRVATEFGVDESGIVFVLLDRAHDESYHVGHVWIEWHSDVEGERAFRGFYPDLSKVSNAVRTKLEDTEEWLKFFPMNAVPGRFERDIHAQELRERKARVLVKDYELLDAERARLDRRCFIPPGRDHVPEGLYSWNEDKPEEHNCSSWAIFVVNHTKNDPQFIVCARPKRLKHVTQTIWGIRI